MKFLITGHRIQKLQAYDVGWIKESIQTCISLLTSHGASIGLSGMASGVDLWFCDACTKAGLPYIACVPFSEQDETMSESDATDRQFLIDGAKEVKNVRNSWMVENCKFAIVVFDGNKGGTANVFQQLIENNIPFYWINPRGKKIWECF